MQHLTSNLYIYNIYINKIYYIYIYIYIYIHRQFSISRTCKGTRKVFELARCPTYPKFIRIITKNDGGLRRVKVSY